MVLKRISRKMFIKIRPKRRKLKRFENILETMQYYCTNTTIHGLRYIVHPELHAIERFFWLLIFAISSFIASNVIYTLATRYKEAPTSIGIESTNYKISGVPFPSVTLCPSDRVDWNKTLDLEKRLFSNSTKQETLKTFRDIVAALSTMTFGDFDELTFLENRQLDDFDDINITDVLKEVLPSCEVLLSSCWWRNSNRNCCEIFEVQKTEYGFCYSFNSEMSAWRNKPRTEKEEVRPRRATGYGDWSGVKVTIHLGNVTEPPDSDEFGGVILMINEPRVWPNSGTMIPAGSLVSVALDCVSGFATKPVLELDERRKPCRHMKHVVYNQETCLSLCKRAYVGEYCGCNPSFLFPSKNSLRDCDIQDFLCLIKYNDLFNDYHAVTDDADTDDENAMICNCLPECEYYIYNYQVSTVPLDETKDILLDVHFASQTSFRYKMDIVITDLDLIVSFGGIIGLFLGGSLLSAAELIYYLMVAVFCQLRACRDSKRKEVRVETPVPGSEPSMIALPILDYSPIKPRSRKIPVLVNYASSNTNLNRY